MDQPPALSLHRWSEPALGRWCVGVLTALAVISALWSVVLLPPEPDPTKLLEPTLLARVAESFLLAGPGVFYLALYAGRAARSRAGSLIPPLMWLVTVIVLSLGRPEGDSAYLLASYQGLLLAPLGMVGAALGIARAQRRPWPA